MAQGHLKKDPPFFMVWKFSFNTSTHTPIITLNHAHAHLDGGQWYLYLPTWVILNLELELY
jgi:hypothetical protein